MERSRWVSPATGLGLDETALLAALADLGATADALRIRTDRVLDHVTRNNGFEPDAMHELLHRLASSWWSHLRLVDPMGNLGTRWPPAEAAFTEVRLSRLGEAAVAAERDRIGPLPIGLINGDLHRGGSAVPLDPSGVLATILATAVGRDEHRPAGAPLHPSFPCGCEVDGDIDALLRGRPVTLSLSARIERPEKDFVRFRSLPPWSDLVAVCRALEDVATALARARTTTWVANVHGPSPRADHDEIDVRLKRHDDEEAIEAMRAAPGISTSIPARLPGPVGDLLRAWVESAPTDDLVTRLNVVRSGVRAR